MNFFKSKYFYKFSRNPLSVVGLVIVTTIVILAIFAPFITPFPEHVGPFTDFANKSKPPSSTYIFGTDKIGRDIFTRVIFGYRISLTLGIGIFTTLFSVYFIARLLTVLYVSKNKEREGLI